MKTVNSVLGQGAHFYLETYLWDTLYIAYWFWWGGDSVLYYTSTIQMLKFHVDLGMWDIIHLLYLFRSYFFICTFNPESLKFYASISSFMQRYPVFSQVYTVLSKASRLSKDLKFYPRMEVSSKDMKIYLGILIFFTGIEFYPKIEALSKDMNCYPRFELPSKDIRKVH